MRYRTLGRTGLQVSALALGTVALGMDYGIPTPKTAGYPSWEDATALIHHAVEAGINLFDTAPAYGRAEAVLGAALVDRDGCYVATKVPLPRTTDGLDVHGWDLRQAIEHSMENSRRTLQCDTLDIVQLHNPTVEILARGEVAEILLEARRAGNVQFLGASVYTEDEALAAIATGWIDVLQVAFNILDQRMAKRVLAAATEAGVGVITRSAFLKGALTEKAAWLPPELDRLRQVVEKVNAALGVSWQELPRAALRFCLEESRVSSVLVGPVTRGELEQALVAAAEPWPAVPAALVPGLALLDPALIDPRQWPIP